MVVVYAFNNPKVDCKADNTEGIQFHKGTWNAALELANKEHKLIFLDIYATWCRPCKKLKKLTFSDEKVGQFYNLNFINVSFDGEQEGGLKLVNQYHLKGYPSLLFIDSTGKVVFQSEGYQNSNELIVLWKRV